MPRLRVTTALSLLMLAGGIAGTGWLSTLTAGWSGPAARPVVSRPHRARARVVSHPRMHEPMRVVQVRAIPTDPGDSAPTNVLPPPLVPLSMPSDTSQPWYKLRGHLDGRVVMHVDTDGHGRVDRARLVESSGDPVLDDHALRSVRGWRFAVPADHPAGVSGELPMRFSSVADRSARAP